MGLIRFIRKGVSVERIIGVINFYLNKSYKITLFHVLKKKKWYFVYLRWFLSKISSTDTIEFLNTDLVKKYIYSFQFNEIDVSYSRPNYLDEQNIILNPIVNTKITNQILYFENAIVSHNSNLVLLDKKNAYYQLYNYFDINKIDVCSDSLILFHKNDTVLYRLYKQNKEIKQAIWLGGNFSWNYYHLMFEFLVKFKYIENIPKNIPILIDEVCIQVPQFNELITYLNYQKREILIVNPKESCIINHLYLITCPNIIPPELINKHINANDILLNKESLFWLKNNLVKYKSNTKFPKRLYISRKNSSVRRKFNEDEVFECLKKYEFECILPENYSIADQISLFSEAEIIVGGSGAAFTNFLFCNSNCKAIIMYKNKLDFSGFSTLAAFVGIELVYVLQNFSYNENSKSIHESFTIDTSLVEDKIMQWLNL